MSHTRPSQAGVGNISTSEKQRERTLPRLEILTASHERTVQHSVQRLGLGSVTGLGMHDVTLTGVGFLPFLPHPVSYYLQLLLIQTHDRTSFLTGSRAATLVRSALVTEGR